MSFRSLCRVFNAFPLYVRLLLATIAVGLLLTCLAQRELVDNAVHLLQALPPVVILPLGRREPPKEEDAEQVIEQQQTSL